MSQMRRRSSAQIPLYSWGDSKLLRAPPQGSPLYWFDFPRQRVSTQGVQSCRTLRGRLPFLLSNSNAAKNPKHWPTSFVFVLMSCPRPYICWTGVSGHGMLLLSKHYAFIADWSTEKWPYFAHTRCQFWLPISHHRVDFLKEIFRQTGGSQPPWIFFFIWRQMCNTRSLRRELSTGESVTVL